MKSISTEPTWLLLFSITDKAVAEKTYKGATHLVFPIEHGIHASKPYLQFDQQFIGTRLYIIDDEQSGYHSDIKPIDHQFEVHFHSRDSVRSREVTKWYCGSGAPRIILQGDRVWSNFHASGYKEEE